MASELEILREIKAARDSGDTASELIAMRSLKELRATETPAQVAPEAPQAEQVKPEGTLLDVVLEPAQAVASSLAGQVGGGIAGLVSAPFVGVGEASKIIEKTQQAATEFGAPETQRGEAALETLGDIMEKGIDLARFPISGLAGLAELISGQGIDQAVETIKSVQEKGIGQTAGDRAFEITGNPLIATIAGTSPEIIGSLVPVTKMVQKRNILKEKLADQIKGTTAQPELANKITQLSNDVKSGQLDPAIIRDRLKDIELETIGKSGKTASKELAVIIDRVDSGDLSSLDKLDDVAEKVGAQQPQKSLAKYMVDGAGKAKGDPLASEAIKQGFDQGTVATIKGASDIDRSKMAQMVAIMKRGKEDALYAAKNRPADIAGDSLLDRVKHVKAVNRESGAKLDEVAKSLRGQQVDFTQPINNFLENLDELGISIGRDLKPIFKGSDIEGLPAPESAINLMVKRLSSGVKGKVPDAHDLHRIKKYIDENVTHGKSGEGLKGVTERVLKQLRREIDSTLDNNFPEYDLVNTTYADTIGALDALQDVAGKKMDLFGRNADKAVGTLLRRLMSNAQSRITLTDAVEDLNVISKKYGGVFNDDIATQMLFADELDNVFGPVAKSSLAGEVSKGVKKAAETVTGQRTVLGTITEVGAAGVEKLRGINEEAAFKSIDELLGRQ